ncbi:hypothetical protein [Streptomyces sp. NPDC002994]
MDTHSIRAALGDIYALATVADQFLHQRFKGIDTGPKVSVTRTS